MQVEKLDVVFPRGQFFAKTQTITLMYCIKDKGKYPFALQIYNLDGNYLTWDLGAFRPDIRDNINLMSLLKKRAKVTVLYEKINIADKLAKFPRYIIWIDEGKPYYFVNVR